VFQPAGTQPLTTIAATAATAGAMARSIKPWQKVGNVPRQFALSSVGVGETECVSSVSVTVVLVHTAPDDIRITLTRVGKQSAAPRATNISTTIVLKDFDSTRTLSVTSIFPFFYFIFCL
jgi:subtilisin-like proprotein convertase family protein